MTNTALMDRLDALAKKQGLSDRALSLQAGLDPHAVRNIRRGHSPRSATLSALAKALGVPVGYLLDASVTPPAIKAPDPPAPPTEARVAPALDLPVFATRQDGADAMMRDADPATLVARPPLLAGAARAFGLYVTGESASPAYEQGDLIFVSPSLPVTRGGDVLLIGADERRVAIRRVVSWTEKAWRVRHFYSGRETDLPRQTYPSAQPIVGKYNRR